jgi:hypothetical protein
LQQGFVGRLPVIGTFPRSVENVEERASEVGLRVKRKVIAHKAIVCFGQGVWNLRRRVYLRTRSLLWHGGSCLVVVFALLLWRRRGRGRVVGVL